MLAKFAEGHCGYERNYDVIKLNKLFVKKKKKGYLKGYKK